MKRWWSAVALMVFASISSLFVYAPAADANSSGQCLPTSTEGCITLVVHLNVTNGGFVTSAATVTAVRQGNPQGYQDSNFTLSANGSNVDYTSGGTVFGTSPDDDNCANAPSSPLNFFKITVAGSAAGTTAQNVNLCANANPIAGGTSGHRVKNITINVQASSATATLGGIKGSFSNIDLAGNTRPCDANSKVEITGGPTIGKGTSVDSATPSHFDTGLTLAPGTYTVAINCSANGSSGPLQKTGVVVKAGQITDIGLISCDARANGCGVGSPAPTPPGAPVQETPTCDAGAFTWVVCPLISVAQDGIKLLTSWVEKALTVTAIDIKPSSPSYQTWSAFRNLADVFFIVIFFVIIFGTGLGLDNYTVKKILPRLIAASILVQFSLLLVSIAIDISNVLGVGVTQLIGAIPIPARPCPEHGSPHAIKVVGYIEALTGLGVAGGIAIATGTWLPALLAIGSGVIALITVFLTLELRLILINFLLIIGPIAFVLWVLPNTAKYFNMWLDYLTKLLLMFPLIMIMLAGANLFSVVTIVTADCKDIIGPLFASLIPILVFFLIPATFKLAGQALNFGHGIISKGTGGADKGIRGAAMNKDRVADRQAKALAKLRDLEDSGASGFGANLRKRSARSRAGYGLGFRTMPKGVKGQRLNRALEGNLKDEVSAANHEMENLQFNDQGYGEMEKYARTGTQAQQIAAISRMAMTAGGRDRLRSIKSEMEARGDNGVMSDADYRTWSKGLEKLNRAAAPDLVKGSGAFKGVSPSEMAAWDPGTARQAVQHWNSMHDELQTLNAIPAATRTQAQTEKITEVTRVLTQAKTAQGAVEASDKLKAQIEPGARATLSSAGPELDANNVPTGRDMGRWRT